MEPEPALPRLRGVDSEEMDALARLHERACPRLVCADRIGGGLLGVPVGTVKSRLQRARVTLADLLGDTEPSGRAT